MLYNCRVSKNIYENMAIVGVGDLFKATSILLRDWMGELHSCGTYDVHVIEYTLQINLGYQSNYLDCKFIYSKLHTICKSNCHGAGIYK